MDLENLLLLIQSENDNDIAFACGLLENNNELRAQFVEHANKIENGTEQFTLFENLAANPRLYGILIENIEWKHWT
jgi:hypothetical protein